MALTGTFEVFEEQFVNTPSVSTQLSSAMTSVTSSCNVTSATGFPLIGRWRIRIDAEILYVTAGQGTATWSVSRGQEGTTATAHGAGAAVRPVLTVASLANAAALNGVGNDQHARIYLGCCHKSTDANAYLVASADGKTWRPLGARPIITTGYTPTNQRDPSLFRFGGAYYLAHTNGTNSYFSILKSFDLQTWTWVVNVDCSSIASLLEVWAPSWFCGNNGAIYIFITCSTGAGSNHQPYWVQTSDMAGLSTWTAPTLVGITTGGRTDMIDAHVVAISGITYMFYKDDSTKYVEILKSVGGPFSGYNTYKQANWAGWGSGFESPALVQVDAARWRLYVTQNSGLSALATLYDETTDNTFGSGWSGTFTAVKSPWVMAAARGIVDVRDIPTVKNMLGQFISGTRPTGAAVSRATNQAITTATTTAITFTTADNDDESYWDTATKLTANAPGWYIISASATFAGNSTGRRVIDIRRNGSDFFGEHSVGNLVAAYNNPILSTSAVKWLDNGDYIELAVFQDSGGNLNVSAANLNMVRLA